MNTDDKCVDRHDGTCQGRINYPITASALDVSYSRCEHHWYVARARQRQVDKRNSRKED